MDQEGNNNNNILLVYSNHLELHVCTVSALSIYLFSYTGLLYTGARIFTGGL